MSFQTFKSRSSVRSVSGRKFKLRRNFSKNRKPVQSIIIGIVVLVLIIFCILFIFFKTSNSSDKSKLYGTWVDSSGTISYEILENGTLNITKNDVTAHGTYSVKNKKLIISLKSINSYTPECPYEFESDDILIITGSESGEKSKLYRQGSDIAKELSNKNSSSDIDTAIIDDN